MGPGGCHGYIVIRSKVLFGTIMAGSLFCLPQIHVNIPANIQLMIFGNYFHVWLLEWHRRGASACMVDKWLFHQAVRPDTAGAKWAGARHAARSFGKIAVMPDIIRQELWQPGCRCVSQIPVLPDNRFLYSRPPAPGSGAGCMLQGAAIRACRKKSRAFPQ